MTFRVKLRIKSVEPHYPVKSAPALGFGLGKQMATDPELLQRLFGAGAQGFSRNYNLGAQKGQVNVSGLNNLAALKQGA